MWGSLVGTQEKRLNFDNFGSRKAFLIILFVAPEVEFLNFFGILAAIDLHLQHWLGCCVFMTGVFNYKNYKLF